MRTTRHRVGEAITLESMREFTDITGELDGQLHVDIEAENGQRDAVYYYLVVTETLND